MTSVIAREIKVNRPLDIGRVMMQVNGMMKVHSHSKLPRIAQGTIAGEKFEEDMHRLWKEPMISRRSTVVSIVLVVPANTHRSSVHSV